MDGDNWEGGQVLKSELMVDLSFVRTVKLGGPSVCSFLF